MSMSSFLMDNPKIGVEHIPFDASLWTVDTSRMSQNEHYIGINWFERAQSLTHKIVLFSRTTTIISQTQKSP